MDGNLCGKGPIRKTEYVHIKYLLVLCSRIFNWNETIIGDNIRTTRHTAMQIDWSRGYSFRRFAALKLANFKLKWKRGHLPQRFLDKGNTKKEMGEQWQNLDKKENNNHPQIIVMWHIAKENELAKVDQNRRHWVSFTFLDAS